MFGAEDAGGVGIEGDGEGAAAEEAGAGDDLGDDALVAEVDAVEVADGGDDGAEVLAGVRRGCGRCSWATVLAPVRCRS